MDSPALLGQSAAFRRVLEQAEQVATTAATVLLLGETGTGKELVATHIHELSARHDRAMVRVNCAAGTGADQLRAECRRRRRTTFSASADSS